MARNENDIEQAFCDYVARQGYRAYKLVLFSEKGWPDRTIPLAGGRICYIEFKSPTGKGRESPQQRRVRAHLTNKGHPVLVTQDLATACAWFDEQLEISLAL